ncbi:hypothetical protein QJS10_CPA01g01019 [Acorus calamus]|uniref:Uncharacterized protein n=1 Tax=Acorus calamus TaxID=4465 RepID=A0AAV9FGX6_ACOCL|nr:hypothetical protein QJS10_CPA01g01019 [Acorus calamus]
MEFFDSLGCGELDPLMSIRDVRIFWMGEQLEPFDLFGVMEFHIIIGGGYKLLRSVVFRGELVVKVELFKKRNRPIMQPNGPEEKTDEEWLLTTRLNNSFDSCASHAKAQHD